MKRVLSLLVLLAALALVVLFAATLQDPERAQVPQRSAGLAVAEAAGEVTLVEAGAVEAQREELAREAAPVVEDMVESAAVGPADELDEVRATLAVATQVLAVAIDYRGQPLAERELELAWCKAEEVVETPQPIALARTGADGAVRFGFDAHALADRPISLRMKDTASGAWAWSEIVVVSEGAELDLGTLVLALPRELHPQVLMSGRVTDDNFAPIPGVVGSLSRTQTPGAVIPVEPQPERWEGEVVIEPTGHFAVHGPATVEWLTLSFAADGHHNETLYLMDVPSHGLEVFLARRVQLHGRLIVPEHGPSIRTYAVWLSEEGRGMGITPGQDGSFSAVGSTRSIEVKVTQPSLGLVLFREDFVVSPESDGELGTVDLRSLVKVLDIQLVDREGIAIANTGIGISVKGAEVTAGYSRGQARTDADGRLFVSVPAPALEGEITVVGRLPVVVDLVSPPARVEVP